MQTKFCQVLHALHRVPEISPSSIGGQIRRGLEFIAASPFLFKQPERGNKSNGTLNSDLLFRYTLAPMIQHYCAHVALWHGACTEMRCRISKSYHAIGIGTWTNGIGGLEMLHHRPTEHMA